MNRKGEPYLNFFRVNHSIIESESWLHLKPTSKILYFILCKIRNRYGNKEGWFWRSDSDLARDCGFSIRSVAQAKKELVKKDLIEKIVTTFSNQRTRKATVYRVLD